MTHDRPTLFQSPRGIVYTPDPEGNILTVNAGHGLCRDLALALREVRERLKKSQVAPPLNWQHQTTGWSTASNNFVRIFIHYSAALTDKRPWWWRLKTINDVQTGRCETAEEAMEEAEKCWGRIWLEVTKSEKNNED